LLLIYHAGVSIWHHCLGNSAGERSNQTSRQLECGMCLSAYTTPKITNFLAMSMLKLKAGNVPVLSPA